MIESNLATQQTVTQNSYQSNCSNSLVQVLVLYRKRESAMRRHEHGGDARFRYSDLKEAARFAADAVVMQIQMSEE